MKNFVKSNSRLISFFRARKAEKLSFLPLAFGIFGFLLLLILTWKCGLGMRQDAITYVTTAESILQGKGFYGFTSGCQKLYVHWPPLYPLLLALVDKITSIDPIENARILNALFFGLIVLFSGFIFYNHVKNKWIALVGCLMVLFSKPLLFVSVSGWSESLFIALVLVSIVTFQRYLEEGKRVNFYLSSIFASLAVLTRYLGLAVITIEVVFLFFRKISLKKKFIDGFIFGIISSLPISIWMIRNYILTRTLTGPRGPSKVNFIKDFFDTYNVITLWFLPPILPSEIRFLIFSIFALFIAGAIFVLRKSLFYGKKEIISKKLLLWISFIAIYTFFLFVSRSKIFVKEDITDRFLSPLFTPLLLISLYIIDRGMESEKFSIKFAFGRKIAFVSLFIFLASLSYWAIAPSAGILKTDGRRIIAPPNSSSFINYLKRNPLRGDIYSNSADILNAITGIPMTWSSYLSPPFARRISLDRIRRSLREGKRVFLVWYSRRRVKKFLNPQQLRRYFKLYQQVKTPDGEVYLIRP